MTDRDSEFAQKFTNDTDKGVVIKSILPSSHASSTNLQVGDVILEVNNVEVNSVEDFEDEIAKSLDTDDEIKRILLLVASKNRNNIISYVAINIME